MDQTPLETKRSLLNQEQVAQICGVSVTTVKRWARNGEIPCKKVGRTWKFVPDKLERFLGFALGTMPIPETETPLREKA